MYYLPAVKTQVAQPSSRMEKQMKPLKAKSETKEETSPVLVQPAQSLEGESPSVFYNLTASWHHRMAGTNMYLWIVADKRSYEEVRSLVDMWSNEHVMAQLSRTQHTQQCPVQAKKLHQHKFLFLYLLIMSRQTAVWDVWSETRLASV